MRTIKPGKCAHASVTLETLEAMREARGARAVTRRSSGTISCSRCTSSGACRECAQINMARIHAGLIVAPPIEDQVDNLNNICVQPMTGKFRGHRPLKWTRKSCPGVTAKVVKLGGGWRQGVAMLNRTVIYRGPATRDQLAAWEFATSRAEVIRMGM